MTAQVKPDRCPTCGSDERSKCNLLPTPAGYEDLCCDDWHSSPVPAAAPQPQMMRLPYNADYPDYKETHPKDPWCAKARCVPASAPQAESVPSGKDAPGHTSTEDVRNCIDGTCHCDARKWLTTNGEGDDLAEILTDYAASIAAERDRLKQWKREAVEVMNGWGKVQEYVNNNGGRLGHSASDETLRILKAAERSNSLLRERITAAVVITNWGEHNAMKCLVCGDESYDHWAFQHRSNCEFEAALKEKP